MVESPYRIRLLYVLYAVSGLVGLSYQAAWFRIFVDRFGSTNLTFVLVICNFIAGLGLGAICSRPFTNWLGRRTGIAHPLRMYGLIELLLAAAALLTLLAPLIPPDILGHFPYRLDAGIYRPVFPRTAMQIVVATICMLVPCFLMGTTFPLLCYAYRGRERFPSALYAWNTLGACVGILFMELVVIRYMGHRDGYWLVIAVNLALAIYFLARGTRFARPDPDDAPEATAPAMQGAAGSHAPGVLLACAVLSGFLAGSLEGDVFKRIWFMGCSGGPTMPFISFWAILAIFLASWTVDGARRLRLLHIKFALVVGLLAFAGAWQYRQTLMKYLSRAFARIAEEVLPSLADGREPLRGHYATFGDSPMGLLLFVGVFVFPLYYCVSLLLPYVCNRLQVERRHLGFAYGLNTIAFCLGVIAFGWLAPFVNIFYSLKLFFLVFSIGLLFFLFIPETGAFRRWMVPVAVVAAVASCAMVPADFDKSMLSRGNLALTFPVSSVKSNGAHTSYVVNTARGKLLYFDHHSMSATSPEAQRYMRLMAHFPLLAHPDPKTALLICFGVGNTASAIAAYDTIERLDAVDLNDKVFETAPEFANKNHGVYKDPRVRLIHDDGRNFLAVTDNRYDLITSEPPPPMQEGVYRLYTTDYYESILEHLTPNGMMTQWLPIEQMPPRAVEIAIRSFIAVFPHTLLFVGTSEQFILMGSPSEIDLRLIEKRFAATPRLRRDLRSISLTRPEQVLARIVKLDATLRSEFAAGPVLRDEHNDFRYIFHERGLPAVVTYDPIAVLKGLENAGLASLDRLRPILSDLALLKWCVPDFADSSLMTVRDAPTAEVRNARADWLEIERLNFGASEDVGRKEFAKAAARYARSLKLLPDQPVALFGLGKVQLQTGMLPEALATMKRLDERLSDDPLAKRSVGAVLLRMNRPADALPYLESAFKANPDDQRARDLLDAARRRLEGRPGRPGPG